MRSAVQRLLLPLRDREIVLGDPVLWWRKHADSMMDKSSIRRYFAPHAYAWAQNIEEALSRLPDVDRAISLVVEIGNDRFETDELSRLSHVRDLIRTTRGDARCKRLIEARAQYESSPFAFSREFARPTETQADLEAAYQMLCELASMAAEILLGIEADPAVRSRTFADSLRIRGTETGW